MRVVCRYYRDGELAEDWTPIDLAHDDETPAELLNRKAASHRKNGWTVERGGRGDDRTIHAWKEPSTGGRKDRYFRIEDAEYWEKG